MATTPTTITTKRIPWQLLTAANPTPAASATARTVVATASLPATLIDLTSADNAESGSLLALSLVGVGAAGTPRALVIGWKALLGQDLWFPSILLDVTGTLGSGTFTLSGDANFRVADVMTPASGVGLEGSSSVVQVRQLTAVVDMATVLVDVQGFERVEIQLVYDNANKANAMWSLL